MSKAADLVEQSVHETLTCMVSFSLQKIRTPTIRSKRIMREIRRRTRVVGAFPDGQSCLNLAAARLRAHRRNGMVNQALHEHAAALPAAGHANRSRRLIKMRERSGHYRRK